MINTLFIQLINVNFIYLIKSNNNKILQYLLQIIVLRLNFFFFAKSSIMSSYYN